MGKRVVAIESGRIVRDEEGAYGFEQKDEGPAFELEGGVSFEDGLSFDYLEEVEKYV